MTGGSYEAALQQLVSRHSERHRPYAQPARDVLTLHPDTAEFCQGEHEFALLD